MRRNKYFIILLRTAYLTSYKVISRRYFSNECVCMCMCLSVCVCVRAPTQVDERFSHVQHDQFVQDCFLVCIVYDRFDFTDDALRPN